MENFIVLSKIGEGAYSTVFTVKRIEDQKIYALKKVNIQKLSSKEQANALNEVRILASINSPYVIGYKESFIDEKDKTLCIVMEFADDGDLFQKIKLYIQNKTFFMEADIWRIFIQITKGLHDLHEFNILHRDLKSANVFLFKDGTAKLGDLNVSKVTTRGLGCTQTGTPYYASPEVWRDNPYNLKSDIWSLGCVFYELIMLKTPFRADSMKELYKKVMLGVYPPISKNFSPKFQVVIDKILKVKSQDRPNTSEIFEIPEVKEKIEELGIFKTDFETETQKELYSEKIMPYYDGNIMIKKDELKQNSETGNYNDIDKLMITRLNNPNRNNDIGIKSNRSCEIDMNKFKNFLSKNSQKQQIMEIYQKNLDYFKDKFSHKPKFVLNTIRYSKKLKLLNGKLPEGKYQNESTKNRYKKSELRHNLIKVNLLPIINNNFEYPNTKRQEEKKDSSNNLYNEMSNNIQGISEGPEIKNIVRSKSNFNPEYIKNALKYKLNTKKSSNLRKKFNIIFEE